MLVSVWFLDMFWTQAGTCRLTLEILMLQSRSFGLYLMTSLCALFPSYSGVGSFLPLNNITFVLI